VVFRVSIEGPSENYTVLFSEDRTLTGPFHVLPEAPADYIKLIDTPDLTQQLQACITPRDFRPDPNVSFRLSGKISIRNCPANVAFDVIARCDGKDHSLNTITCNQGGSTEYFVASNRPIDPPPAKIDIILRSSEKAARSTVDQYEMWKGELVFPDVPMMLPDPK
jgi:hypothetical protein